MSKFWQRVRECDHESISPDYAPHVYCPTPYCSGTERHCLDCGVYLTECKCGWNNGMSGWPWRRWLKRWKQSDGAAP